MHGGFLNEVTFLLFVLPEGFLSLFLLKLGLMQLCCLSILCNNTWTQRPNIITLCRELAISRIMYLGKNNQTMKGEGVNAFTAEGFQGEVNHIGKHQRNYTGRETWETATADSAHHGAAFLRSVSFKNPDGPFTQTTSSLHVDKLPFQLSNRFSNRWVSWSSSVQLSFLLSTKSVLIFCEHFNRQCSGGNPGTDPYENQLLRSYNQALPAKRYLAKSKSVSFLSCHGLCFSVYPTIQ